MKRPSSSDAFIFTRDIAKARRERQAILSDIRGLRRMHQLGLLGGEIMPEDAHPDLPRGSKALYHYFTLCMALNYQRNSYALWRAATAAFNDEETRDVFEPAEVGRMSADELRRKLLKHKVALQPKKHTQIWMRLSKTIAEELGGDVRNLFKNFSGSVPSILEHVQKERKRDYPYLCGPKISNYWLYVMDSYTDASLKGKEFLSVAPDTHVIQATQRLGLVALDETPEAILRLEVARAWRELLAGTELTPIDIHTPLWLWSRAGFIAIVEKSPAEL